MKVKTAVILAGGYGTRMLPVTAAVEKVLLPILDRPVIDYVVADCVASGIETVIFVTPPDPHGLRHFYRTNRGLETYLKTTGKTEALEKLHKIHKQATFICVEQPPAGRGRGTAAAFMVAVPHLPKGEPVLMCSGDEFLWRTDGGSDIADLLQAFQDANPAAALMAQRRPKQVLHHYGVDEIKVKQGREYLVRIVEKPAPGTAPSNVINLTKQVISPTVIEYIRNTQPNLGTGEAQITDAFNMAAKDHDILIHKAKGHHLDAGSLAGWLEANLVMASQDPKLKAVLKRHMDKLSD